MNYFKAAELVLSSVPALEKANKNLERRLEQLIKNGAPREPGAIDYEKPFVSTHAVNNTLNDLLELAECRHSIEQNKQTLEYIREITEQLEAEHKKLISLWYFSKLPKERVMEQMNIESLSTVYNLRNKAVAEFALLYYGAVALPSI